jgi:hypothetical protein
LGAGRRAPEHVSCRRTPARKGCGDSGHARIIGAAKGAGEGGGGGGKVGRCRHSSREVEVKGDAAVKDDVLESYVKSLIKSAEYCGKYINYIELRSLIKRFLDLNPHLDPKVVDWVGVWDDKLTYSEQIENFRHHYPHFRWSEETITEESFEDSRKKALWEIVRTLDEQSLRELAQLIEKELGGPPQAQTEQKKPKEPVVQPPTTTPPTQQTQQPVITLKVLAGVPVLLEARAFASAFEVSELLENHSLIEKTKKRVEIAIRGFPWPFGDPLEDLLTFGLGMLFISQIRDRRIWERWAEAEAKRIEAFMSIEDDEVLETVWKDLLIRAGRSGPDEEERTGFPYKIHITDYSRLAKGIDGAEWKLERRTVWRGWVYVTRGELVRLISEEAKLRILRKLETTPRVQAKQIQKIVDDIKQTLTLT